MPHMSQPGAWFAALMLSAALIATATAAPTHRAQYEVYDDQQAVANEQTPSELQSHGRQQSDPQASEQSPSSEQQNSGQAASEQTNAFVSEEPIEPQDVAQAPQGEQAEQKSPEQTSEPTSESPASQTPQAPPAETESGEDDDPYNL